MRCARSSIETGSFPWDRPDVGVHLDRVFFWRPGAFLPLTNPWPVIRQIIASKLDDTGYSGHISFILHMLGVPGFRETYLAGEFKPEEIAEFGKSCGIIINRLASTDGYSPG